MAKSTTLRKADPLPSRDPREDAPAATSRDRFLARLTQTRSANEITSAIGLKPIKGRSGPKIAY